MADKVIQICSSNDDVCALTRSGRIYIMGKVGDWIETDLPPDCEAEEIEPCNLCKHWNKNTGWCNRHGENMGSDDTCSNWIRA